MIVPRTHWASRENTDEIAEQPAARDEAAVTRGGLWEGSESRYLPEQTLRRQSSCLAVSW